MSTVIIQENLSLLKIRELSQRINLAYYEFQCTNSKENAIKLLTLFNEGKKMLEEIQNAKKQIDIMEKEIDRILFIKKAYGLPSNKLDKD